MHAPTPLTNATTYSMQVAGIGIVGYKYQLNNDGWSVEYPVSQKIEFDVISEGSYALQVIGKGGLGVWQIEQTPTVVSWIVDTTPPDAVLSNYPGIH